MAAVVPALSQLDGAMSGRATRRARGLPDRARVAETPSPERAALLRVLAEMPDEAFGWLVVMIANTRGSGQVWPDGLGGFQDDSRTSIKAAIREARALMERAGR